MTDPRENDVEIARRNLLDSLMDLEHEDGSRFLFSIMDFLNTAAKRGLLKDENGRPDNGPAAYALLLENSLSQPLEELKSLNKNIKAILNKLLVINDTLVRHKIHLGHSKLTFVDQLLCPRETIGGFDQGTYLKDDDRVLLGCYLSLGPAIDGIYRFLGGDPHKEINPNTSRKKGFDWLREVFSFVHAVVGETNLADIQDPPQLYQTYVDFSKNIQGLHNLTHVLTYDKSLKLDDTCWKGDGQKYTYRQELNRLTESIFSFNRSDLSDLPQISACASDLIKLQSIAYLPNCGEWKNIPATVACNTACAKEELKLLIVSSETQKIICQSEENLRALQKAKRDISSSSSLDAVLGAAQTLRDSYQLRGGLWVIPNFIKKLWNMLFSNNEEVKPETGTKVNSVITKYKNGFFNAKPSSDDEVWAQLPEKKSLMTN